MPHFAAGRWSMLLCMARQGQPLMCPSTSVAKHEGESVCLCEREGERVCVCACAHARAPLPLLFLPLIAAPDIDAVCFLFLLDTPPRTLGSYTRLLRTLTRQSACHQKLLSTSEEGEYFYPWRVATVEQEEVEEDVHSFRWGFLISCRDVPSFHFVNQRLDGLKVSERHCCYDEHGPHSKLANMPAIA
eukprot:1160622-Pelagomonas_calceolata.AAC.15